MKASLSRWRKETKKSKIFGQQSIEAMLSLSTVTIESIDSFPKYISKVFAGQS
jgi:hypothetical protein